MDKEPKNTGFLRIIKACGYTRDGLVATFKSESAFRQELALAAVLLPLACWLAPDGISLALMTGSVLLVLIVELLNSALEKTIDRIGEDIHPLSKQVKDTSSAAVFLALVNAAAVWFFVLT